MVAMRIAIIVMGLVACGSSSGGPSGTSGPYFDQPMFFNTDVSARSPAS